VCLGVAPRRQQKAARSERRVISRTSAQPVCRARRQHPIGGKIPSWPCSSPWCPGQPRRAHLPAQFQVPAPLPLLRGTPARFVGPVAHSAQQRMAWPPPAAHQQRAHYRQQWKPSDRPHMAHGPLRGRQGVAAKGGEHIAERPAANEPFVGPLGIASMRFVTAAPSYHPGRIVGVGASSAPRSRSRVCPPRRAGHEQFGRKGHWG
jgi:hypothetical protein